MLTTTNTPTRPLNFLRNPAQAILGRGGQIAWEKVSSFFTKGKFTVKLAAAALKGAIAITVDALTYPLDKGTVLDFGEVEAVVVTLSGNEAIGQTTLSVNALSGPLPAGAILDFGAGENIVKLNAAALEGAVTIDITEALTVALESGDAATYQGGRMLAKLTEDGSVGETALTVEALQYAIADDAEAIADYTGSADSLFIPAGTIMVRDTDDKLFPRHDVTGGEDANEILQSDANRNSNKDAKSGYGTLRIASVYENLLPDADPATGLIPAGYKTELVSSGANIEFSQWSDSRAS